MGAGSGGRRRLHADLAVADLLVVRAALQAGAAPAAALGEAAAPALDGVRRQLDAGTPLSVVAADAATLPASTAALVRALAVAETVGAPSGPAVTAVLDGVATATRQAGLVQARSAQARLTARLLTAMPLVGASLLLGIDPAARRLVATPLGLVVCALAALLMAVAAVWIRRLTARAAGAGAEVDPLLAPASDAGRPRTVASAGTAVVGLLVGGPAVALLATAAVAVAAGRVGRREPDDDRGAAGPADGITPTAEALELLALALASGAGLAGACRIVADLGPATTRRALRVAGDRLDAGVGVADALGPRLAEPARLIDLAHRWGAPTAEPLRVLAAELRGRAAAAAEEAAERLSVHLVLPTTLLLVPAFGLLVVTPVAASALGGLLQGGQP